MQILGEYIKRSILGFLAIVLFSNMTFAFSIDIHYCQDRVKSVSYFGQTSSCQMPSSNDGKQVSCGNGKSLHTSNFDTKPCCSNKQFSQDISLKKHSRTAISIEQQVLDFVSIPNTNPTLSFSTNDQYTSGEIPFPPLIVWNQHRIAIQVFQI